jgi:hypothetical protein
MLRQMIAAGRCGTAISSAGGYSFDYAVASVSMVPGAARPHLREWWPSRLVAAAETGARRADNTSTAAAAAATLKARLCFIPGSSKR